MSTAFVEGFFIPRSARVTITGYRALKVSGSQGNVKRQQVTVKKRTLTEKRNSLPPPSFSAAYTKTAVMDLITNNRCAEKKLFTTSPGVKTT